VQECRGAGVQECRSAGVLWLQWRGTWEAENVVRVTVYNSEHG
jgi:hypothetical protein